MPRGTVPLGKAAAAQGKYFINTSLLRYPAVKPDLIISQRTPLNEFGIDGYVEPTPGHSSGSISLLLKTGEAFVGDLAVNFAGLIFPPFAESRKMLLESWQKIISCGVKTVCPAHGAPFSIELLKETAQKIIKPAD